MDNADTKPCKSQAPGYDPDTIDLFGDLQEPEPKNTTADGLQPAEKSTGKQTTEYREKISKPLQQELMGELTAILDILNHE